MTNSLIRALPPDTQVRVEDGEHSVEASASGLTKVGYGDLECSPPGREQDMWTAVVDDGTPEGDPFGGTLCQMANKLWEAEEMYSSFTARDEWDDKMSRD